MIVPTTADGSEPRGNLIFDAKGNLYGTTYAGAEYDLGAAFELTPGAGGVWKEKLIYIFGKPQTGPWSPTSGVIFDSKGNLYGTTIFGGSPCDVCGTVFELSPGAGGKWNAKTLHSFNHGKTDGYSPQGNVAFDAEGDLYGTTFYGGVYISYGIAFELTPAAGGSWTEKLLHSFGNGKDGARPVGNLVRDKAGNLYGTTSTGGENGEGAVFEIVSPHKAEAP